MSLEIGGFIELNLLHNKEYHPNAYKVNLARHSINLLLENNCYQKAYLPKYISDTVYNILKIPYEFYELDENFMAKLDHNKLGKKDVIIYPNYFGINNQNVLKIIKRFKNVIIDNVHAFYHKLPRQDVVYSARKFFGVPDGAYMYSKKNISFKLNTDSSHEKFLPLMKKKENGSNASYEQYLKIEKSFDNTEPKLMSKTTMEILGSINYENDIKCRIANYNFYHKNLKKKNLLDLQSLDNNVPMVYPFLYTKDVKNILLKNNIYLPTYYYNSRDLYKENSFEFNLIDNLIALPVDSRINKDTIKYILSFI